MLKLLGGNSKGFVEGKVRQALQGTVDALPAHEVEHLVNKYSGAVARGALKDLVPALKRARQSGGRITLSGIRNSWRKRKNALSKYTPKNVIRGAVRGATDAAIDGMLDSVIPRVEMMQSGSGIRSKIGKSGRMVARGSRFVLDRQDAILKGLEFAEKVGSLAATYTGQSGGRLGGIQRANNLLNVPWELKGVHAGMSGAVLSHALNRLSTDDRATAIELLKRGHKY